MSMPQTILSYRNLIDDANTALSLQSGQTIASGTLANLKERQLSQTVSITPAASTDPVYVCVDLATAGRNIDVAALLNCNLAQGSGFVFVLEHASSLSGPWTADWSGASNDSGIPDLADNLVLPIDSLYRTTTTRYLRVKVWWSRTTPTSNYAVATCSSTSFSSPHWILTVDDATYFSVGETVYVASDPKLAWAYGTITNLTATTITITLIDGTGVGSITDATVVAPGLTLNTSPYVLGRVWLGESVPLGDGVDLPWTMSAADAGNLKNSKGQQWYEEAGEKTRVVTFPFTAISPEAAYGIDGTTQYSLGDVPSIQGLMIEAGLTGEVLAIGNCTNAVWSRRTCIYGHLTSMPVLIRVPGLNWDTAVALVEER